MENCSNCGAKLAPGAEWCGQCLAPAKPSASEPEMSGYLRANLRPTAPPVDMTFSRWKAGPESSGPVGRGFLTILLIIGVFVGYFLAQGGMVVTVGMQIPAPSSYVMYAILAIPLSFWGLKTIWKKARIK